MPVSGFGAVHDRAVQRKGGEAALAALLAPVPPPAHLLAVPDDRMLAEMTRCVFQAGFVWKIIEAKWPGFEAAFQGFVPGLLLSLPPEEWDAIASDPRIIRNGQKVRSVMDNARFVADTARQHGSFARFLAEWPDRDQMGLCDVMKKRGSRLGGATGQRFLRSVGKDSYVLSTDTVRALREAGLSIDPQPTSKRDLKAVQEAFNAWHDETGLAYTHLSKIAAFSTGDNRTEAE